MKNFPSNFVLSVSIHCVVWLAFNVVDAEDFKSLLLNNGLFVDKSLLINELLQRRDTTVILRPNGWGKSTNMDMLKRFFEIEVDEEGSPLPEERTVNDKLFLGGTVQVDSNRSKTLEALKIANFSASLNHLGKHPVILLNLGNTFGNSYEETVDKIRSAVTDTYRAHRYLLNSSRVSHREQTRLYMEGKFDDKYLRDSLCFLSEQLHQHFDQKVVILIDDYDAPVMNAYTTLRLLKKPAKSFHFHVEGVLFDMFNYAFKPPRNPWLELGLLVGEHLIPVDDRDCLHSLASIFRLPFESGFAQFYGFTHAEVRELLSKVPEQLALNGLEIKNWYNGYSYSGQMIYNARSIVLHIAENGTLKSYASDRHKSDTIGYIDRILTSDEMQRRIQTLICEDDDFTYRALRKYVNMDHKSELCTKEDQTKLLIDKGYLALDREKPNDILWRLYIPNNEMKHIFQTITLQWVYKKFATDDLVFRSFANSLVTGNFERFAAALKHYHVKTTAECLEAEDTLFVLYNGLIAAIKITLSKTHIVIQGKDDGQNWRYGQGHDVHVIPTQNSTNVAVFMKWKIVEVENVQSIVNESLKQIDIHLYENEWENYRGNIRRYSKVSIAVSAEVVSVKYDAN